MSGRFAIRVIIICSFYAILYFAYNHFSLKGSFILQEIDRPAVLYIISFINLAGLSGSWLLSRLRSGFDTHTNAAYRFMLTGGAGIIWIILMSTLCGWIYNILFLNYLSLSNIREDYPGFIAQGMVLAIFTAIVFAVLDHSLGSYKRLQVRQLQAKQMMTQQLDLQFETLRNQISPHFLFNSLNTISSLVYRDVDLAEKFIRSLAGVYYSVMEHYEHPVISLDKELALVKHYSYLMQVRFENAFYLDIR